MILDAPQNAMSELFIVKNICMCTYQKQIFWLMALAIEVVHYALLLVFP